MRYECKYCGKNFTPMILAQLEGKITRQDVLDYKCCDKKSKK